MSRVDLQLITDVDMYHFVENSIRGGISMFSNRNVQASSPSFPDTYDTSLSGRKQFVWVGNVSISTHSWISFAPTGGDFCVEVARTIHLAYIVVTMTTLSPTSH